MMPQVHVRSLDANLGCADCLRHAIPKSVLSPG